MHFLGYFGMAFMALGLYMHISDWQYGPALAKFDFFLAWLFLVMGGFRRIRVDRDDEYPHRRQ